MKKVFVSFSILSTLILFIACKPTVDIPPVEPEEPAGTDIVTSVKEDPEKISALRIPFDIFELDNYNASFEFSNGNWEIVDINQDSSLLYTITTKVSYEDGNYNCTSMTMKVEIPRGSETEESVDYEEYYSQFVIYLNNANLGTYCTFSHGLLTDNSVVLIIQFDKQLFNRVYLSKLPSVQPSQILSNYARTKYMIDYSKPQNQETIFVYKLEDNTTSSEFADCTISGSSSEFNLSDGKWFDREVENQPNGKLVNFFVLTADNGQITKDSNYQILTIDLQALAQASGMSGVSDMSDLEKLNLIKAKFTSSSDPDSPSYISVLVDEKNIICAFQATADTKTYNISIFLPNNDSSIKTNSNNSRYVINGSFENVSGETITETLYLHKVN